MGHDTGTYTDSACETSTGVLHEYPAGCKPYEYWTCSTYSHMCRHRAQRHILHRYVKEVENGKDLKIIK